MAEAAGVREAFEVAVEESAVDLVQDRLDTFWTHDESVSVGDRMRFEMALVEVVANIVEHAFEADAEAVGRVLAVELSLSPEQVEAVLSDNGLPAELDLGSVTMPGVDAVSGRGLALAVAAVDELRYDRVGGRNHWRLLCRRAAD